ncbi:nuclear transport factor 2 family protein [Xanthobacter sp. AM11]|uniref:nuclear transport factor 2 family protein n=1 Tax=Xanthobacter sp. AM11 TaxID=3380643 RepID=UPI0039BFD09F
MPPTGNIRLVFMRDGHADALDTDALVGRSAVEVFKMEYIMPNDISKADIALDIQNFMARFWNDVEKNEGRRSGEYFAKDAIFDAKLVCFNGRDQICDWYRWRERAERVSRHLITNCLFDFAAFEGSGEVEVRAVMTHFGADGKGVHPTAPPIAIYDYVMRLQRGGGHGWTIVHLETDPVFLSPDHVALRYPAEKGHK